MGKEYSPCIHELKLQIHKLPARKIPDDVSDHFWKAVDANHRTMPPGPGQIGRPLPVATAQIQDAFIPTQLEPGDEFVSPDGLRSGTGRIVGGT